MALAGPLTRLWVASQSAASVAAHAERVARLGTAGVVSGFSIEEPMRTMALALSLFTGALVSEVDFGQLFNAAEAKSTEKTTDAKGKTADVRRTATQQRRQRKHASKGNPTLPPNLGPGVGSGL